MTMGQVAGAQRLFAKRLFNHPFWRETGSTTAVPIKIGLKQMANVEMTCILCAAEKPETVQSTRARLPAMSGTYFVLTSIISCSGAKKTSQQHHPLIPIISPPPDTTSSFFLQNQWREARRRHWQTSEAIVEAALAGDVCSQG